MTKRHFIALADAIRLHQAYHACGGIKGSRERFTPVQIESLATFCASQNPQFNRSRWLAYIAGECGPNGGAVKGR